jgi:hypothetical protein
MSNNGFFHRRWWWLIIGMTVFGLFGWGINAVLPVRYTQSADMQLTFLYSDDINWNDNRREAFTRTVGRLIESPQVISDTITNAQARGLTLTEAQIRASIKKEQRFYGWTLTVTSPKADTTQVLIDSWQAAITSTLDAEQSNLLAARTEEQQAKQWFACLQQLPVEPADPACSQENADTIAASYQQAYGAYTQYRQELQFLQLFSPDFSYHWRQVQQEPAPSPLLPVGVTILIAAMIGLIAALLAMHHPLNGLSRPKISRANEE